MLEVDLLRHGLALEDVGGDGDRVVGVLLGEERHASEEVVLLDSDAGRLDADRVAALSDRDTLASALGQGAGDRSGT